MLLPAAGVNVTRPATSRNARPPVVEPATPATGTFRVTFTVAVPPAGTLTDDVLSPSVCAEPAATACATVNDAAEAPLFFSVISRVCE